MLTPVGFDQGTSSGVFFPGGSVRETARDGSSRTLEARIGVRVRPVERVMKVSHAHDDYTVTLAVWRCELEGQEPEARNVHALAWVGPDEFADYPFPGADQKTVDLLLGDS